MKISPENTKVTESKTKKKRLHKPRRTSNYARRETEGKREREREEKNNEAEIKRTQPTTYIYLKFE